MSLTKKHYVMIANAICEARKQVEIESGNNPDVIGGANAGFYELVKILSNEFFMDNPRFDENTFISATEVLYK